MGKATGALFFCTTTRRYLFLLRDNHKYANTWCFPGGKVHKKESEFEGALREAKEELGGVVVEKHSWDTFFGPTIQYTKVIPIEKFTSDDGHFEYHTFMFLVDKEFIPELNKEHRGYCWTSLEGWPKPLHPGVFGTLKEDVIKEKLKVIESTF